MEIEYCHEKNNPLWDDFVQEIDGEVVQTSLWANYEYKYYKINAVRFFVKDQGTIVAGCQISILNDELFGNIGLVRLGPCFNTKTPELMKLVVSELKNSIQILNLSFLLVYPNYNEHDLNPFLENEKFEKKFSNRAHPPYKLFQISDATLFLDLSLSTEDILKQMRRMRRRGIKKGLDSPVKIKHGERDDLKTFYDLYIFTVRSHKYIDPITHEKTVDRFPVIESYQELCQMWDELSPKGWVKLFLGTVEDEIICGVLVFPFGKIFRNEFWGWNLKYPEYHISDAIHWEMIQWAKTNGFHYFDFVQINISVADAFYSNEPMPDSLKALNFYGPTIFKLEFGGSIIKYPGEYICYSNKMKHLIDSSEDELKNLMKTYHSFYWAKKNFFRDRPINFDTK